MAIRLVRAPRIDFTALRRELRLPEAFPADALREADEAVRSTRLPATDRTDIPFVTVDPATSKDLDQAVHISRLPSGGYRVRYAIADVAAYVRPGGALEAETWARGQTVYLPDGKISLHPESLSEDAVSLLPDVDRAAVVWTIDLDADAATTAVHLERARVRSRAKLDYVAVQAAVDEGRAPEAIALLSELGTLLAQRAADRGAVNLPLPEQEIEPLDGGWRLVLRAPLPVEEHNAQISLLTGMSAATLMLDGGIGMLRTMPAPRADAVQKLRAVAASLGVTWPDGASVGAVVATVDPASARGSAFLDQAAELLRGAGYTAFDGSAPAETGHGGVGAPYAHVTAPLRRLADRYVTETCLALYEGRPVPDWAREALPKLPKVMSDTDRVASAADRGAVSLTEAVLLKDRVGEEFDAAVLDVDAPPKNNAVPQNNAAPQQDAAPQNAAPKDAAAPRKPGRKQGGSVALDDPPVRARCEGALPLGERIRVRLTVADPATRNVLFEQI